MIDGKSSKWSQLYLAFLLNIIVFGSFLFFYCYDSLCLPYLRSARFQVAIPFRLTESTMSTAMMRTTVCSETLSKEKLCLHLF